MSASPLKPLHCASCGAGLTVEQQQTLVTCPYCGQSHTFEAPAATAPVRPGPAPVLASPAPRRGSVAPLVIGIVAAFMVALGGAFFVMMRPTKPPLPKPAVHATPASYAAGELVRVKWGSTWWDGRIEAVRGKDRYLISYDGYDESWNEEVDTTRLRKR